MKIVLVSSEAVPYAKTGGLADVAGVLPRYIAELGHDIRVVMPLYGSIDRHRWGLRPVRGPLGVPMGVIGELWSRVWEGRLPDTDVPVYFLEHEGFFARDGLYNDAWGNGYLDNDNRFVFLSRGALQLCKMLHLEPDVVHVNDWHTAAIPVLMNTLYRDDPQVGGAASLLSLHNMQYQGTFYEGVMDVLGVGWEHFNFLELEFGGQVNLLKGGIYHATLVNTVSPGYLAEIRTPEGGFGLDGVLRDRGADVRGILNGIDTDEWNPAADPLIPAPFDADDLRGKAVCKQRLQQEMGLPVRDVPLYGFIGRLVDQKGVDVLAAALDRLLEMDVQLVLLGTGQPWAHAFFAEAARRHPTRFAARLAYDNGLAHRIEAGCDFFVMPSRFEPCGLNQLFSLRYGTLPIVHAVGGLDDTVENYDERTLAGTGFKFWHLSPDALLNTAGWACYTWYNRPDAMQAMIRRAMARDVSWDTSAREYVALYEEAVARRRG